MRETWVWSLGREDPLKKEMATHSSTLAWKIPWTEKPDRLQTTGSQRVRHDWVTSHHSLQNTQFMYTNSWKWSVRHSVMSDSLRSHGLYSPWTSPGQDAGVGIFPTQGSNPGLPHCRQILYQLSHQGSPTPGRGRFLFCFRILVLKMEVSFEFDSTYLIIETPKHKSSEWSLSARYYSLYKGLQYLIQKIPEILSLHL